MLRVYAGEDTFRSRAAFVVAKNECTATHDVVTLQGDALTEERLASALQGQTLFGAPSAVALEDVTKLSGKRAQAFIALLEVRAADHPVIAWESGVPDGRSALWAFLKKHADSVEMFAPLSEQEAAQWVQARVKQRGASIEPQATRALLNACGANLWSLATEIEKLCLYAQKNAITAGDVDELVPMTPDANVFGAVRALTVGDVKTALQELSHHRALGNDARVILSLTIRELRILITIRDLIERKTSVSSGPIARAHHIPPFAADALIKLAKTTTLTHLRQLHDRLVVSLYGLNTGRVEADDVIDTFAFQAIRI